MSVHRWLPHHVTTVSQYSLHCPSGSANVADSFALSDIFMPCALNFHGVYILQTYHFHRFHVFKFALAGDSSIQIFAGETFAMQSLIIVALHNSVPFAVVHLITFAFGCMDCDWQASCTRFFYRSSEATTLRCVHGCSLLFCSHYHWRINDLMQIWHTLTFGDRGYACFMTSKNELLHKKGTSKVVVCTEHIYWWGRCWWTKVSQMVANPLKRES